MGTAAAQVGIPIAGAALGGLGGKSGAKAANSPIKSGINPASQLGGWGPLQGGFEFAQNALLNPPDMSRYLNQLPGGGGGGGAGGGGGGGGGNGGGGGGGGGGLGHPLWQRLLGQLGGGGGGGGGNITGALGNIQKQAFQGTPQTDWEKWVTSQQFQDVSQNPLLQAQKDAYSQDAREEGEWALSESFSPFAQAGGTMGMSGANVMGRGRLADSLDENTKNALANMDVAFRGQNLGVGDSANQAHSGRINQAVSTGGTMDAAARAAAASRYGSLLGTLGGMYGADASKSATLGAARIGAGTARAALNSQNAFNRYDRMYQAANAPRDYASTWLTQFSPAYSDWGTKYQQGPQASPGGAKMSGMLGGGLSGLGATNLFKDPTAGMAKAFGSLW